MWIERRNKFTAALDEVAPKVSITVRSRKNRCPWMTPCLLNLIHKQKSLHRKIIRSNKQNQEAMKGHRQIRSLTLNMYRNLKNEYFQQRISEYRKLPKRFWSTIRPQSSKTCPIYRNDATKKFNPLSTGQSKIGRRRPISLDYHCVNISQRIFINKISLERSFHYLNAHTLFLKIGHEMTPLQPFEVTQLIDFALDRSTSVTCGRDFAHSITMVT